LEEELDQRKGNGQKGELDQYMEYMKMSQWNPLFSTINIH
jgi:hypothetical protein